MLHTLVRTTGMVVLFLFLTGWGQAQVTADFTADVTTGCGSLQVSFTDESVSTNSTITDWAWNLGGVNAQNQNPGRIFGTPGTYEICLTVTDAANNTDTKCIEDYIEVFGLPEPNFEVSAVSGCAPLEVIFTDLSVPGDAPIVEWVWGLGGSGSVFIQDDPSTIVSSTYTTADEYTVSLTVEDVNGCTNVITRSDLIVLNPDPEITISVTEPFGCQVPFTAEFTNENIDPNLTYDWDFGNGMMFTGATPDPVVYNNPGTYAVTVMATDQNTNCNTTTVFENILQVGYPVDIDYQGDGNCQGATYSFTDNSTESADSIRWDFGDGQFSNEINPTHVFDEAGCFSVTLIRYTADCPSELTIAECIEITSAPVGFVFSNNSEACSVPHAVNFLAASNEATSWTWDFQDGTTSTNQNPTHEFNDFGVYPVALTIEDSVGCTSTYIDTIKIIETTAQLNVFEYWGCAPYEFILDENSATSSNITEWNWEIFDENNQSVFTSDLENPMVMLNDTGLYNLELIVVNEQGCRDTALFAGAVAVGNEVTANFTATPIETCIDGSVSFTDLSTETANFWIYDFGDGGTSHGIPDPRHEYVDTGYFDIHLAVFHYGCYADTLFEDYIHVNPPIGNAFVERNCANPYEIAFEDRSHGADSVFWDFGESGIDTDTSTLFNPVHVFSDTGCFQILHTVYNFTTLCEDTDTISLCITDPQALFSISNTDGCVPLTIEITDNSIHADNFEWIAEGATIVNASTGNPTITYQTPGLYNGISLVVNDVQACSDTLTLNEPIYARGLEMDFITNTTGGCKALTVDFEDASISAFSQPVEWSWNIGPDLVTSDQENFSYTFDTSGLFSVELTVTDGDGCTQMISEDDFIEVTDPMAVFSSDTLSCTADMVSFSNQSTGGTLTYLWDFGDGNTSTDENPMHQYTSEGIFTVCLSIEDQYGCSDMICKDNLVEIIDPSASFTVDSTYAFCPPLLSQFQSTSQNANYFEWDFGDNSGTSDLENPPHVYTIPGSYSVQLIAGSTANCRDTFLVNNLINLDGPVGEFSFVVDTSCAPMNVQFTGMSDDIYDYIWDYGNGDLDTTLNVTMDVIDYQYPLIDTYVPKLILIDDSNCARAIESPDSITVTGVNVDFVATNPIVCEDMPTTSFINLTQSTSPINQVEWILEGTDIGTTTASEPTATYLDAGLYDVTLMVETDFCRDTLTQSNFITVGTTPNAYFTSSALQVCQFENISFTDSSSIAVGGLSTWEWDFGDGNTANIPNPVHQFATAGIYEVILTVTSNFDCADTHMISVEVLPVPDVSIPDQTPICRGESITLSPLTSGDTTNMNYEWTPAPGMTCTDCWTTTVSPTETTIYEFSVVGSNGCSSISSITIEVLPFDIPIIEITPDTAICASDVIQLTATGGTDIYAYQWDESRPGLSCYSACLNPIANPESSTTYVVTVTNGEGCSAIDSVTIDIVDQFQPLAGEDQTICQGDTVTLTTGVPDLVWTNPAGLSCTYCPDPLAFPDTTKIFRMQLETESGCMIQDSVSVTVLTKADINAGEDQVICSGSTVTLSGSGVGVISWFPEMSLDNPSILTPTARPSETTNYILRAEEGNCILRDSVLLEVVDETTIEAMDANICIGDTIGLEVTGNADFYEWNPSESLSARDIQDPNSFATETTTYTVIGTLENCPPDTAMLTVEVEQGAGITLRTSSLALPNQPLVLLPNVTRDGNYAYSWFPEEGLSCSDCLSPTVDSASIGQVYTLLVTDLDTGCEIELTTATGYLRSCGEEILWVPSGFSPNNDGINDELFVYSPVLQEITAFRIFNRWGAVVFHTNDMNQGWNGQIKGKRAEMGVYVYFVEAICPVSNQKVLIKGDVTLVR